MGDVVQLKEHQDQRWQDRAAAAARHPALRWVAGDRYWIAHSRDLRNGGTVCGATGSLVLAPPGVPLCADCRAVTAVEETG